MPANKKPRKAYDPTRHGRRIDQSQQNDMLLPIRMSIQLLPRGEFSEAHAHNLAAFLTTVQVMAKDMHRPEIVAHGGAAAEVLLAMKERVNAGKSWNVTTDERDQLLISLDPLDTWSKQRTDKQWSAALRRALVLCDKAAARGQKLLTIMED